jgi:sigma-B regulation protein RsbU (phosphoserine phosphatase)
MKRIYNKNALVLSCGIFLVTFVIVLSWRINVWNTRGWTGMEATYFPNNNSFIISNIIADSPADIAGITINDELLAINGIALSNHSELKILSQQISSDSSLVYLTQKNNIPFSRKLFLRSPLEIPHIHLTFLISMFAAVVFFLLGFFVYWKKLEDPRAFIFFLMSLSASVYFILSPLVEIDRTNVLGIARANEHSMLYSAFETFAFVTEFLPILFLLHLALIFPKERPLVEKHPLLFRWMYWFPLLLIPTAKLFLELPTIPALVKVLAKPIAQLIFMPLLVFIVIVYPVSACIALVRNYHESGVEEKVQVKWPLLGTVVAISGFFGIPIAMAFMQGFTGHTIRYWFFDDVLPKIFFLAIPVSYSFAILKYRLMDIDVIIKKTISYSLLSGIVLLVYFSLVAVLGVFVVKFAEIKSEWFIVGAAIAIATMFVPARNRVQVFVDKRFFRKKYDYPSAVRMLNRTIAEAKDLSTLLKFLVENLQQTLQNRAVVFFTRTPEHSFVATEKVGVPDDIVGKIKFPSDSELVEELVSAFEIKEKPFSETVKYRLRKIHSAYIIPVILKGEVIAFLSLGSKLSDAEYDDEDKEFLSSVVVQLAIGISNLHVAKQEQEYEEARKIQEGLLPKEIPQIPGYEICGAWLPSRIVGGDYYDVIKLSETKLAICIGDVSGKGMPAALMMSNLQASVKAFATENNSPPDVCAKINRVICSNISEEKYITFFYGILDAETKKIIFTNCGHNPPLVIRTEGKIVLLEKGGTVLGVFREFLLEQGELALNRGDRICFFTDGITEAQNRSGVQFEEVQLQKILLEQQSKKIIDLQKSILKSVSDFCNNELQDDVTLVLVESK